MEKDNFQNLSSLLYRKFIKEESKGRIAKAKQVLTLIAKLGHVCFSLPEYSPFAIESMYLKNEEWKTWKKFNQGYLKATLKRLKKQKMVEIEEKEGKQIVTITEKGKKRILQYALDELTLKKSNLWDGKWRLVIYDIASKKKRLQNFIRYALKKMEFYPLQESVYLTPYPCFEEIEFLRQFYGLEEEIKILVIAKLEGDSAYRSYFGL